MFKQTSVLLVSALLLCSGPGHAREFGGVAFAEEIALPDTTRTVKLNGVGYRKKFFVKVYIGALYTERLARSRDEVIALEGPRRVLMHFVHDEVSRDKLVDGWNEGFEDNLSDDHLKKLSQQIDRFTAMFPTVKRGDVIYLDYIPGVGTRVTVNRDRKGVIPGRDFNNALMDIFLGKEPADSKLKKAMLGR